MPTNLASRWLPILPAVGRHRRGLAHSFREATSWRLRAALAGDCVEQLSVSWHKLRDRLHFDSVEYALYLPRTIGQRNCQRMASCQPRQRRYVWNSHLDGSSMGRHALQRHAWCCRLSVTVVYLLNGGAHSSEDRGGPRHLSRHTIDRHGLRGHALDIDLLDTTLSASRLYSTMYCTS